jgi:PleD family two-component response regulator
MITTIQLFFIAQIQSLLIFVSLSLKQSELPNRPSFSSNREHDLSYINRKHNQRFKEDNATSYIDIGSTLPSDTQYRILIVDDEPDITRLFKLILEQNGFAVDALSNYKVGTYSLLLLDIKMPNMNGSELYKKIKNIDNKTPVCFITAYEEYISEFKKLFPKLEDDCFIKNQLRYRIW